jgi:hypothetical protein
VEKTSSQAKANEATAESVPTTEEQLALALDAAEAYDLFKFQRIINSVYRSSEATGNPLLQKCAWIEGAVFELFWHENDVGTAIGDPDSLFGDSDRAYIERRRNTTTNARLKALYAHALAWANKRFDSGEFAADAYREAVNYYCQQQTENPIVGERVLRDIAPLTVAISRRYRRLESAIPSLIAAGGKARAVLRLQILELLVPQRLGEDQRQSIRPLILQTIEDLAGTSLLNRMVDAARLGIRSDAKLGKNDQTPWNEALLAGLKKTIDSGEHVLLRERAAQQAALVLQKLGANEERADIIQIQRQLAESATATMTLHSEPLDADGSYARYVRQTMDEIFAQHGELGALTYLGLSQSIMPRLRHAREAIAAQQAQGLGVFRQLAETVVRSRDNRVIGHGSPGDENQERALWEQFGFGCLYSWYTVEIVARHLLANGSIRFEHFESLLRQSWLNDPEPGAKSDDLVDLLMPALRIYYDVITEQQPQDMLVPMIDSLTPRFEAIFRKLARRLRISDVSQITDNVGRVITEVRGVRIIDDAKFAGALGEDLHALATQTLIGHDEGLRDSVGHALMPMNGYHIFTAHSLVFLLLRMSVLQPDDESTRAEQPEETMDQSQRERATIGAIEQVLQGRYPDGTIECTPKGDTAQRFVLRTSKGTLRLGIADGTFAEMTIDGRYLDEAHAARYLTERDVFTRMELGESVLL